MIQHVHWYSVHHADLPRIVLEDENHVEVLEVELHSLEVDELYLLQGNDEGGPLREVHQGARGWLQQHRAAERRSWETKFSEKNYKST